jgi:predicted amidohydrolase YtcJ
VVWDAINFHNLLNQVQSKNKQKQKMKNTSHTRRNGKRLPFWGTFWHPDCWSKTSRYNRKIIKANLIFPFWSTAAPHNIWKNLKMLEACNDQILKFRGHGGTNIWAEPSF